MHDSLLPPHHRFLMVIFNCFCKLWEDYNSVFFIRQPTILISILIIFNTKLSKLLYYSFLYSYMASSFLIDSSTISFVILYGLWSISFISTAIFAISDSLAIGAVRALIDAGKRVPMDISVAGFDGTEMAAYYNPSITTIRQPAETMARETIKLLFDSIKKKTNVQQLIFEGELVPGESVKKLN